MITKPHSLGSASTSASSKETTIEKIFDVEEIIDLIDVDVKVEPTEITPSAGPAGSAGSAGPAGMEKTGRDYTITTIFDLDIKDELEIPKDPRQVEADDLEQPQRPQPKEVFTRKRPDPWVDLCQETIPDWKETQYQIETLKNMTDLNPQAILVGGLSAANVLARAKAKSWQAETVRPCK